MAAAIAALGIATTETAASMRDFTSAVKRLSACPLLLAQMKRERRCAKRLRIALANEAREVQALLARTNHLAAALQR